MQAPTQPRPSATALHPCLLDGGSASGRGAGLCRTMGRCQLRSSLQSKPAFPELHNEKPHLFLARVYSFLSSVQGPQRSHPISTSLQRPGFKWHPRPVASPTTNDLVGPPCSEVGSADRPGPLSHLLPWRVSTLTYPPSVWDQQSLS